MFIVFFRAIILYIIIIFSVRLMGKRQIGELQPAELVITILMSNIATLPVEDINIPMIMGIAPIFTLVSLDVILSHLSMKYRSFRKAVSGSPKIIISNGVVDRKAMKDLRLTADDLMASLRSLQIFDINQVQFAVMETTGKISVCKKGSVSPPTAQQLKISTKPEKNPPMLVIDDGEIAPSALEFIGKDENWLRLILKRENISPEEIFIMTADGSNKYTIIKKEDANFEKN